MKWICCQLGARENFAIPRALFRKGLLEILLTDAWVAPQSLVGKLCRRRSKLTQRFHNELRGARVESFTSSLMLCETVSRARGLGGWEKIMARDRWFQQKVVGALKSQVRLQTSESPILLSYSYTALDPFRYAKAQGWKTVLVQIDPGPEEERIVAREAARMPDLAGRWQPAPAEYWAAWREECKLADRIVVNSEWSRDGLVRGGIPSDSISVVPLAYEGEIGSGRLAEPESRRNYPARFTSDRPLRVLFLGLINLRKGSGRLLEAARILADEAVEFWMVGPVEIAKAMTSATADRVKWFGPVTRNQTAEFYRNADVFILPTLSDGFAITQLEAQRHGLPVIASKFCGKVIENDVNGIILDEPTAAWIVQALRNFLANPDRLQKLAEASVRNTTFTLSSLGKRLEELSRNIFTVHTQ